ncbi:MAG: tetratricopeptide repeat protein [Bacteroidota bacterium]|nr:tetratricopeptide repeat protein [Bacteroidota bacterium]
MRILVFYCFLTPLLSFSINIDSLTSVLRKEKEVDKKIDLYSIICENSEGTQLLRIAKEYYAFSKTNRSEKGVAQACDNLGYYYQINKPDSAIYFYKQALSFYEKQKDPFRISTFHNQLGVCYFTKGDLNAALDHFLKCTEYTDKKKGFVLNNIAQIYVKLGQLEKAMATYSQSINYFNLEGDTTMAAAINQNIGMMYLEKFEYDKAEKYLLSALNKISPQHYSYTQALANLGLNYSLKGEPEKGKIYLLKAASLFRKENNLQGLAFTLANLGTTYSLLGKDYEALTNCIEGYELSKKLGFLENIEKTSRMLARIYEKKGDYKNSLKYTKIYHQSKDSLVSEKIANKLNESNIKYETTLKDLELIKQAEKIGKSEIVIQKQNVEAEKKQKFIFILSLFGLFVFSFSIFIFRAYKQKQQANKVITQQKNEVEKQKQIIEQQKEIVEEHQKEILDSIHYAKRIQNTLLAHQDFVDENLPQNFIFFNPKDIVSGDFYWAAKKGDKFYIAACDSTGHGVPGAFMSLLNIGFLSEAINEKGIEKPNEVLNFVRERLIANISKEGQQDGFDGVLVCFDNKNKQITYSAANNSPLLIQNNLIINLEGDRMPVGIGERKEDFKLYTINANPGDTLYLYTDGYADQFGGPKGKKFKYKPLNELLLQNNSQPLHEQKNKLKINFENWKGTLEQVDDVCVIGIKI